MNILVQLCIVIVTLAIVTLAYMGTRLMLRLDAMTKTLEVGFQHLEQILEDVRQTSTRLNAVIDVTEETALSVRRGVRTLEHVVERAGSTASLVLDEIERPVRKASLVLKGIRAGAALLQKRWSTGSSHNHTHSEGENDVRAQW